MAKITPLDIRKHSFKKGKGYDAEEVDAFLEMIANEYENLIKQNLVLNERLKNLTEKLKDYQNIDKTLRDTLVTAQSMSDEMKRNSMKEAELIVKDAEIRAEQIIVDSKKRANTLRSEIADLDKQKDNFIIKFKSLLKSHLQILEIEGKKRQYT